MLVKGLLKILEDVEVVAEYELLIEEVNRTSQQDAPLVRLYTSLTFTILLLFKEALFAY